MTRPHDAAAPLRDLELVVMCGVLACDNHAYPLQIRDAIQARSGRNPSRAAVFITLERLERKGYLTSHYGQPTAAKGGRAKRYFTATPAGLVTVRDSVDQFKALTAGLDSVLQPRRSAR